VGVEAGYLLQQNLWLSAGFNHTGFRGDADLAGYEYTRGGRLHPAALQVRREPLQGR
jgi:hypothetical protein